MLFKVRVPYVKLLALVSLAVLHSACSSYRGAGQVVAKITGLSGLRFKTSGDVTSLTFSSSGKCLDVNGSSTSVGVQLQQWDCNGSSAQNFTLTQQSDGSYEIFTATGDGLCVDVLGRGTNPGTAVQQWSCNDTPAQRFNLVARANGYEIHPVSNSGFCVDLANASTDNSVKVVTNPCDGGATQLFSATLTGVSGSDSSAGSSTSGSNANSSGSAPVNGQAPLTFSSSGKCLDVNGSSTSVGVQLQQWDCNGSSAQNFTLTQQSDGSYEIFTATGDGLCVDVSGRGTNPGTVVQQWSCNDTPAQRFNLVARANGYEIHPAFNAKFCLDLTSARSDNGVKVVTNPCNGNSTQLFGASASGTSQSTPAPPPAPSSGGTAQESLPAPIAGQNFALSFDDEFTSLSSISLGSTYDGSKWYNGTEQCCIVDSSNLPGAMFPSTINGVQFNPYQLIPGGGLDIQLVKKNNAWFTGVLTSVDQNHQGFKQQYGYFEMTAQMPSGDGVWPAFWMLSTDPNMPGEIDIMEYYGHDKGTTFGITLHDWRNGGNNSNISNGQNFPPVSGMTTGYHTYGFLWTESTMTFYFDGKQVWQHETPEVMKHPYYLLINNGLGGYWPTNNTPDVNDFLIKSVRAYQSQ